MIDELRTAAIYLLCWPVLAVLSCAASFLTLTLLNVVGRAGALGPVLGNAVGLAANLTPSILAGLALYAAIAARCARHASLRHHLVRAAPLYLLSAALTVTVVVAWREPDFGLVAPLAVWPIAGTAGAIAGDLWGTRPSRGNRGRARAIN